MCVHKHRLLNTMVPYPSRKLFNSLVHIGVLAMESYGENSHSFPHRLIYKISGFLCANNITEYFPVSFYYTTRV